MSAHLALRSRPASIAGCNQERDETAARLDNRFRRGLFAKWRRWPTPTCDRLGHLIVPCMVLRIVGVRASPHQLPCAEPMRATAAHNCSEANSTLALSNMSKHWAIKMRGVVAILRPCHATFVQRTLTSEVSHA